MKKNITKTQIQENIKNNAQKRAKKRAYFIKMNNRIPKKKENMPLLEPIKIKTQIFLTKKEQKTINKAIAKKLSAKKLHFGERKVLLIDYKIEKWKKANPAPCSKDDMFKDEFNYKDWETKLNTFIVNVKTKFGINIKNKVIDFKPIKKKENTKLLISGEYDNITIDENGNRHFSIISKYICTLEDEDNVVDITTAKTHTRLNDLVEAILCAEYKKPVSIDSVTLSKLDGTEIFTISPYMWENGQVIRSVDWINKKWEANKPKQELAIAA